MEGRPKTNKTIRITRETKFELTYEQIEPVLIAHLRKVYPEFRGYEDHEIEIDWIDGTAVINAAKEETKRG